MKIQKIILFAAVIQNSNEHFEIDLIAFINEDELDKLLSSYFTKTNSMVPNLRN